MRAVAVAAALVAAAGCGGGDVPPPQLVDGRAPREPPAVLETVAGAVMTQVAVLPSSDVDADQVRACRPPSPPADSVDVVERVGLYGQSLTFRAGSSLVACDAIPDPVDDPDRPYAGIWCGSAVGRVDRRSVNDPRLDLCTSEDGDFVAFAWVEPSLEASWVVVRHGVGAEVYETAGGLPVRVTTIDGVDPEGSASFDVEEYSADGTKLRSYTLDAAVAG